MPWGVLPGWRRRVSYRVAAGVRQDGLTVAVPGDVGGGRAFGHTVQQRWLTLEHRHVVGLHRDGRPLCRATTSHNSSQRRLTVTVQTTTWQQLNWQAKSMIWGLMFSDVGLKKQSHTKLCNSWLWQPVGQPCAGFAVGCTRCSPLAWRSTERMFTPGHSKGRHFHLTAYLPSPLLPVRN